MIKRLLELVIEMHKRTDVNALSDDGWRAYQAERREMESALKRVSVRRQS
jgi:IS1 family transposase